MELGELDLQILQVCAHDVHMLCIWERDALLGAARQLALSLRCCRCGVDPAKIGSSLRNVHRIGADIGMKWLASVVSEQTQPRDRGNL